jgi:hypothetical protein
MLSFQAFDMTGHDPNLDISGRPAIELAAAVLQRMFTYFDDQFGEPQVSTNQQRCAPVTP